MDKALSSIFHLNQKEFPDQRWYLHKWTTYGNPYTKVQSFKTNVLGQWFPILANYHIQQGNQREKKQKEIPSSHPQKTQIQCVQSKAHKFLLFEKFLGDSNKLGLGTTTLRDSYSLY